MGEQTRLGKVQMFWREDRSLYRVVSRFPLRRMPPGGRLKILEWSRPRDHSTLWSTTAPFVLHGESSVLKKSINKQAKNELSSLELSIDFATVDLSTDTESPREDSCSCDFSDTRVTRATCSVRLPAELIDPTSQGRRVQAYPHNTGCRLHRSCLR